MTEKTLTGCELICRMTELFWTMLSADTDNENNKNADDRQLLCQLSQKRNLTELWLLLSPFGDILFRM